MKANLPSAESHHASTVERWAYYEQLTSGRVDDVMFTTPHYAQRFLEALKSLDDDQIQSDADKILSLMTTSFDAYYATDSKVANALRRAACRVDSAMFGAA
ncbi:hypothetical protein [Cryobacterium sp. Y50]|uniref:hypothetical protein n=1 Tax=Cryobacterium sp. Y50 TaxID=2048286 RepID=UPI0011B013DF|nr:hypothetical protein [Cryobacterium sp. Y50]